ncbi:MAG: NAD-dependent epimerase/dehydratase family protein [Pseudonocardiaceae bacterium]
MAVLITGAAGFIGSHVGAALRRSGQEVIVTDLVSEADAVRLKRVRDGGARYVAGRLTDVLPEVMSEVHEVWHFAANADIPLGLRDTTVDIRESVLLTRHVMESMREHGVTSLVFPSTSGVYGNGLGPTMTERDGPLLPVSLYAAGKVAAEGLISAYCATFGLRARIFRLGNVVGGAMGRGIVRDFIRKLSENSESLPVRGDGRQRKSFVLVDDVIAGMRHIGATAADGLPCDVFNLAAGDSIGVGDVARAVAMAMDLPQPRLIAENTALSWVGDQPVVELSIDKALATGWRPVHMAFDAVRIAAERMVREDLVMPA